MLAPRHPAAELKSYEKRMLDGLNFLNNLKDKKTINLKDFWRIKAKYILTFFDSISDYNTFASKNYYSNSISKAPPKEYPFLAEIKIFRAIKPGKINPPPPCKTSSPMNA